MKKVTMLLASVLVVALAVPVFAMHEEGTEFGVTRFRNNLDHHIRSIDESGTDVTEFFEDDVDIRFFVTNYDLEATVYYEHADSTYAGDVAGQGDSAESYIGGYTFVWTPEALVDNDFALTVGQVGNCWGSAALGACGYGDASDRGAFSMSMKLGNTDTTFEYIRLYEGDRNDDAEGDEHWIRGWFSMPVGESGFSLGGYAGFTTGSDLVFAEADADAGTDAVMGDRNSFQVGAEFSGAAGSVDFYGELGFASGTEDDGTTEMDMSGYYVFAGANFALGQISLGVEAGMGSGDDDPTDGEDKAWLGPATDWWIDGVLHDWGGYINGGDGGINNLTYVKATMDMDPSDKMSLSAGLAYLMPTEEVGDIDNYGIDGYGSLSYTLSSTVSYSLSIWFGLPNSDWIEDTKYVVRNRLSFNL